MIPFDIPGTKILEASFYTPTRIIFLVSKLLHKRTPRHLTACKMEGKQAGLSGA